MSSKDKKKDKFDLEKYIKFDVDKTDDISIKESDEKEETKQSNNQKSYSLLSFLNSKKRPDIYFSRGAFLSGNDYVNKRKPVDTKDNKENCTPKTEEEQSPKHPQEDEEENTKYQDMKSTNMRYFNFNTNITIKCFNCGEIGHMSKNCPNEQIPFCIRCNQLGHEDRECQFTKCFKCNQLGHRSFGCPHTKRDLILCDRCKNIGHNEVNCLVNPQKIDKKLIKYNGLSCVFCGSKEHLICPFPSKNSIELPVFSNEEKENEEEGELNEEKRIFKSITNEEIFSCNFCPYCGGKHKKESCKYADDYNYNDFDDKRKKYAETIFGIGKKKDNNYHHNNNNYNGNSNKRFKYSN